MISGTSQRPVRLGLLGCGTVGGGVVKLLTDNAKYLGMRVGAPLEIARVLVRDEKKERVPELDRALVTTDPELVLGDDTIDVIVETMGGLDPAREWVERAIENKKSVVTANKALLAAHGPDLVERAHAAGVDLAFEGSVGGGIPIIRTLREAFASDWVQSLTGIVNGTCNYVLTRMNDAGLSFDEAVKEAQNKGYAEADPELDVGGHDAAHKLVVLAMLAFGARIDSKNVPTEGIRAIEPIASAMSSSTSPWGATRASRSSSAFTRRSSHNPLRSRTSRVCSTPSRSKAQLSVRACSRVAERATCRPP
jgi:homoserine dehydrogenase